MYKFRLPIAVLFLFVHFSFSQNALPENFRSLLQRGGMEIQKPAGLVEVTPIQNRQMNYEYALKYPDKNFEIRYAIRPLDSLITIYKKKELGKQSVNVDPNKLYNSLLQATILNISPGELPDITVFDKEAVKKEFNADWGATSFVEVGPEFGQKYKYCMIVALHKDNFADAYYFYLSDTQDGFDDLMDPAFHSLKFK